MVFGVVGYLMKKFGFEPGPLVLAFVLGSLLEELAAPFAAGVRRRPDRLLHPPDLRHAAGRVRPGGPAAADPDRAGAGAARRTPPPTIKELV